MRLFEFLKTVWERLSSIGVDSDNATSDKPKKIFITNRIAIIIAGLCTLMYAIVVVYFSIETGEYYFTIDSMRILFIVAAMLLALFFNKQKIYWLAKLLIIVVPVFSINFFPILIGTVSHELLLVAPMVIYAFSIIIHLIIHIKKERVLFWGCMLFVFFTLLFTERILEYFTPDNKALFNHINDNYFIFTLSKIVIFIFVNAILYSVWKLNYKIQKQLVYTQRELLETNAMFLDKNEKLKTFYNDLKEHTKELNTKNDEIMAQNDLILEQKNTILDHYNESEKSLKYAKRILNAMSPAVLDFKGHADYFILDRPKSIVSGDFIWSIEVHNKTVVAVADCTGHGVPGALLSMLGMSLLNDIVGTWGFTKSSSILFELRKKLIESLSQTIENTDNQDGMDISLCVFDFEENTVDYSGAFNPLLMVRNNEVVEFPGVRMPIGMYKDNSMEYTSKIIEIQDGDAFYMFSDGYQDQFGEKTQKKLKKKPFVEIVKEASLLSIEKQQSFFENHFDEWKGNQEQVDDVMVVGIKVRTS